MFYRVITDFILTFVSFGTYHFCLYWRRSIRVDISNPNGVPQIRKNITAPQTRSSHGSTHIFYLLLVALQIKKQGDSTMKLKDKKFFEIKFMIFL